MKIDVRALLVPFVLGAACRAPRNVGLQISLPGELVDQTTWFEVGAFEDTRCASVGPMLGNGMPNGWTSRVAFRRDDAAAPRFGKLPAGRYAFGAVARSETCAVLAWGCKEVDLGESDDVTIDMTAIEAPAGACGTGTMCAAARCVPVNDNSDPNVGVGCSLDLIGAGPLPSARRDDGRLLSAPAIATTSTGGFMIVYREVDSAAANPRVVLLPIDTGGGAGVPAAPILPARCEGSNEVDGVGFVVTGDDAMIALARPPCGAKPALELLNAKTTNDASGKPAIGAFRVSSSPTADRVVLGPARAAVGRLGGGLLVFTQGGTGHVATISPDKGVTEPGGTFGGTSGITDAVIAASDKILALLAVGPTSEPGDAGSNAGFDAGFPTEEHTLRLVMAPPDTTADRFDASKNEPAAPVVFPGTWGSVGAIGERVIVLSGMSSAESVTYRAFDVGSATPTQTESVAVDGADAVTTGDVALVGDRAYFVTLKRGSVDLHVYANATTTPTLFAARSLGSEGRISGIDAVRDGRVAVAANDARVAVVWTTARVLSSNDAVGGYAVFGCRE